ncbi:cysteine protease ATG4A isoform X2 [Delphinapterus leucas]|uniref:Cysteine protease n=1 Tax=Delphinapterus leucas TaxID=9749 RepID=A0A2Y9M4V5_DELLE|nr:cysteine protease ATG4A isoform X2 [Delphinapterus leucas]
MESTGSSGRLWELQFERSSGRGGAFAAVSVSAVSSAELRVPGSLAAAVVKWPVELAQDDSWRMESGFLNSAIAEEMQGLSFIGHIQAGIIPKPVLSKYENQITIFADYLEEFPDTDELVWILGKQHLLKTEKSKLLSDISARLWFTYRRKFSPIGGTGPSSDAGWGCMLRCGQMMLAQALICRHLGRDWNWERQKEQPKEYQRILQCFLDRKDCCYSIHQMAQMGVGEGKSIGEWFGPNTVAQVLKKLALFDEWNSLAVYVSMDNTVVIEDIKKMCHTLPLSAETAAESPPESLNASTQSKGPSACSPAWKPLLLIVPLRLGINQINPVYVDAFKECFKMPQSLGALGGKPNNAYYFIGFLGDELIFLDPHTTQTFVDTEENGMVDDQTFHCLQPPQRMNILNLDPSVALEILKENLRMFELVQKHPSHWPPFVPPAKPEVTTTGAEFIDSTEQLEEFDLEEDFEILSI